MRTRMAMVGVLVGCVLAASPAAAQQMVSSTLGPGDSYNTNPLRSWSVFTGVSDEGQSVAQRFAYSGAAGFNLFRIRLPLLYLEGALPATATVSFLRGIDINTATTLESWTLPFVPSGLSTLFSSGGVGLETGATYWLKAEGDGVQNMYGWAFNDQEITGYSYKRGGMAQWQDAGGVSTAYEVTAIEAETVVPEPMSMILLGTGLLGVGVVARRRKDTTD